MEAYLRRPGGVASSRFVTQARLVRIKGQNVLFSAPQHAIFALNDTAAAIWRLLEKGTAADSVADRLGHGSPDDLDADEHVEAALEDWQRLGLIRPRFSPVDTSSPGHVDQVLAIAGRRVRIVYPVVHARPTMVIFRHVEVDGEGADVLFHVAEHDDRLHLFRDGDWLLSCDCDELATLLKGEILNDVLGNDSYELALHAAALVKDERLMLLCGNPGAGKTTLTMALAHAGFGFASDDVTLLHADGRCVGLPFAPAVKAGAWPLLAERFPDLDTTPVFRRPDNKRVRYLIPQSFTGVSAESRAVGSVVLLQREAHAAARLEPVDPVEALRGLLGGAFAPGGELGDAGFDVLARVIASARTYRLTYSGLDEAVDLIKRA